MDLQLSVVGNQSLTDVCCDGLLCFLLAWFCRVLLGSDLIFQK